MHCQKILHTKFSRYCVCKIVVRVDNVHSGTTKNVPSLPDVGYPDVLITWHQSALNQGNEGG